MLAIPLLHECSRDGAFEPTQVCVFGCTERHGCNPECNPELPAECSGAELVACDGDGRIETTVCRNGCNEARGRCNAVCEPGTWSCQGADSRQCREDGAAWVVVRRCPRGCNAASGMCDGELPAGIVRDLTAADLAGWEVCFVNTYGESGASVPDLLADCDGDLLMLGCRQTGDEGLALAAAGARQDVTFDTGAGRDGVTHEANGVAWYFNVNMAWGFAGVGDVVNKNRCDTGEGNDELRLCWHLDAGAVFDGGFRCGNSKWLNNDNGWERVVLQPR